MIIDIVRNQSRDSRAAYQLDEIDKGIFRIKAFIAAAIMKKYSRILTIKLPAAIAIHNAYSETCTAANQCLNVGNIGHYVAIQANIHASQAGKVNAVVRSEEHTSELQSRGHLVCRLLLEKKK